MIPLWEQRDDLLSENANLIIELLFKLNSREEYLLIRNILKEYSTKRLMAMNEHLRRQVKDECKKVIIVPFTTRPYYYSECGCAVVLERITGDPEYYARGDCEHCTVIVEADDTKVECVKKRLWIEIINGVQYRVQRVTGEMARMLTGRNSYVQYLRVRKGMMKTLVIKNDPRLLGTFKIGWRINCTDGKLDMMWGNTKNDASLTLLIEDARRAYGPFEIVDERGITSSVPEV